MHLYSCSSKTNVNNINVDCEKCSFSILSNATKSKNYEPDLIAKIFCTIDTVCFQNVEFVEFSNEILFEALNNNPSDFVRILQSQNLKKKDLVLNELEKPLSDAIDLDIIMSKLIRQRSELSSELVSRLQKAKSKY